MEYSVVPFPCDAALQGLLDGGGRAEGRYGWFETLAETTLGEGESVFVAVAYNAGTAAAALPLVRTAQGARALTAPYTTRYAPALPDLEGARFLGRRARDYAGGVLRLDAADPDDPGTAAYIEGLEASGLAVARYDHFANWFEPVTDFGSYWRARPSRLRTTVRRKLAQARTASVAFSCHGDDLGNAVAIYEAIYAKSWKDAEPHPAFIGTLARKLAGAVRLGVMTLQGEPVAAQIWLVHGSRATIFKLAHCQSAAAYSPGTLLTRWMAETLIERESLVEMDFGRGDDAYKRDWLGRCRRRTGVIAADRRTRAGLSALLRDVIPTRLSAHRKERADL